MADDAKVRDYTDLNAWLDDAELIPLCHGSSKDENVYAVGKEHRACPKCKFRIEWKPSKCRFMHCPRAKCKYCFCWICLKQGYHGKQKQRPDDGIDYCGWHGGRDAVLNCKNTKAPTQRF
mmetsp:Transcript_10476/g.29365  ORF Transcript_10476/g.29365 Transcript_10476/m.29365 type:complete len:120 (-) Transcript_10476:230-589(-)